MTSFAKPVLYMSSFADRGRGGQESLFHLVTHIDRRRFVPQVILPAEGTLSKDLVAHGIPVIILPLPPILSISAHQVVGAMLKLSRLTRRHRIQLIHTDGPRNTIYAGLLSTLTRIPLVWHVRVSAPDPFDPLLDRLCTRIVCVSNALRNRFPHTSTERLKTIYNGLPLSAFFPPESSTWVTRRRYGLTDASPIIGTLGRIEPAKGQIDLIRAYGILKTKLADFQLILAGAFSDPEYLNACRDTARRLGIADRLTFTGQIKDVRSLLSVLDLFVLPSWSEGFARTVIEAMAAALPCIVTDVGGGKEAVIDGVTGYVVSPWDPEALADRIFRLAGDRSSREAMGRRGRIRAARCFSLEAHVQAVERLYDETFQARLATHKPLFKMAPLNKPGLKQWAKSFYLPVREHILKGGAGFLPIYRKRFRPPAAPMRILFIRIDRIGDMVLATPALAAIRKHFPDSGITVLASPANHQVLAHNPHVNSVVVWPDGIRQRLRTIGQLRSRRYHLAIDSYAGHELYPAMLARLSGAAWTCGFPGNGREVLFDLLAPLPECNEHFARICLGALYPLGISAAAAEPALFLSPLEQQWAKRFVINRGLTGRALVAIHLGAHYPSQRWPVERFIELISLMLRGRAIHVLVIGGPGDQADVKAIKQMTGNEVAVYLPVNLRELIALLARCRALVCNNSGPLHIAAALRVPTVSFMGPTNPHRWWPLGNAHQVLRRDDLACIGCGAGLCPIGTHACLRGITPNQAMERLSMIVPEISRGGQ